MWFCDKKGKSIKSRHDIIVEISEEYSLAYKKKKHKVQEEIK